jgi:Fe-S-cluster-containing dehydrogenase component
VEHTCKTGKGIEAKQIMEEKKDNPHKYGMVIDLDKCTGCGTCMVACASENNVTVRADESDKARNIAWMQLYKINNG